MSALAYANAEDERVQATPQLLEAFQAASGDEAELQYVSRGPATFAIVYPLNRIADHELRTPIVVRVEWDDAELVMSSGKLRIWGAGGDIYAALNDFAHTFDSVLRSYRETPR